jgi:hypothetical protein
MHNNEFRNASGNIDLSKPIHDFHEDVKCKLLNCTNDLYLDHYELKKKLLDSFEKAIKSRISCQKVPKTAEKFDKIFEKNYINTEKELCNQSFDLNQICYNHSEIFDENLKIVEKLVNHENKNYDKEMFKNTQLVKMKDLIAQIKRTRFKNGLLKSLTIKIDEYKERQSLSKEVIDTFQTNNLTKLTEYLNIYEDLRQSNFEFDEEDDIKQDPPSILQQTNDYETNDNSSDANNELYQIYTEIDTTIKMQSIKNTDSIPPSEAISYYADSWDAQF